MGRASSSPCVGCQQLPLLLEVVCRILTHLGEVGTGEWNLAASPSPRGSKSDPGTSWRQRPSCAVLAAGEFFSACVVDAVIEQFPVSHRWCRNFCDIYLSCSGGDMMSGCTSSTTQWRTLGSSQQICAFLADDVSTYPLERSGCVVVAASYTWLVRVVRGRLDGCSGHSIPAQVLCGWHRQLTHGMEGVLITASIVAAAGHDREDKALGGWNLLILMSCRILSAACEVDGCI